MSVFVIRTQDVERTVEFFREFNLEFVQEQHDDGPVHFACQVGDNVFEIYPTEKKNSNKFID